jgi:hypothetical protein
MISRLARRLERLEVRSVAIRRLDTLSLRIRLVHAEKGVTGVLVIGSGNPPTLVPATPEEIGLFGVRAQA